MPPVPLWQAAELAQQHLQAGRLEAAEHLCRQILEQAPQHAATLNLLGVIAWQTGRHELAASLLSQAVAIDPRESAYHNNLGTALRTLGRLEEAVLSCRQAAALSPNESAPYENLGNALQEQGLLTESTLSYERALALEPGYVAARVGFVRALVDLGLVREADAHLRRALELDPSLAHVRSAWLANLHYLEDTQPHTLLAEHQRWNQLHARPLLPRRQPHDNDPAPDRRLRVGYVSPDFRHHPVAFFLESLLAGHDGGAVEVHCYSNAPGSDAVTARLRQHAAHWRDISALDDEQAAALVREDRIDILVDLSGHTAGHRLLVFARKPSPVQVTWLGYCDTTGMDAMDCWLTDAHADPPEASVLHSTEMLVRLPGTFACFRPSDDAPPVSPLPALKSGHLTYASFHTLAKLNAPLLESWASILARVPNARLLLCAAGLRDPVARQRLRAFFVQRGVDAARLEFRGWQGFREYLAAHDEVDVLLDSHPYSGHTVSCHALWMGVPPVTLAGTHHCGRMVASVLHNAGLPEFIARTPGEYQDLAVRLASDLPRLAELRRTMRDRLAASPLLDARRFARAVEEAYRQMWWKWCERAQPK